MTTSRKESDQASGKLWQREWGGEGRGNEGGVGPWLPSGDPEREPGWGQTSCWQKARVGLGGEGPLA